MQNEFLLYWSFNILIMTVFWFVIIILSQKIWNKKQEINVKMYLGYGISSFGLAWFLGAGFYREIIGIIIITVGVIIVVMNSGVLQSSSEPDLMSNDSDMEE